MSDLSNWHMVGNREIWQLKRQMNDSEDKTMYVVTQFDDPSEMDYEMFSKMIDRLHVKSMTFRLKGVRYFFQGTFTGCEICFTGFDPKDTPYFSFGMAKKSSRDSWDSGIGMNVAFCRACRSAFDSEEK